MLIAFTCLCYVWGNNFENLKVERMCVVDKCIPRVVWSHWDKDVLPEDVEEMVGVTKKSLGNFTHILLTPSIFSKYLGHSTFPEGFRKLHPAGKADYIRVCLLTKYGGVYVDSTTYINSGSEMEWFFSEAVNGKAEITTFTANNTKFPFTILPGFFGAVENSFFMERFKKEFDYALKIGHRNYINKTCTKMKMEKRSSYLVIFVIVSKITFENDTMKGAVQILPSNRSCQRLIFECDRELQCVRNHLLYDPIARAHPFLKVWHNYRDGKKFHIGEDGYDTGKKFNGNDEKDRGVVNTVNTGVGGNYHSSNETIVEL